MLSLSPEERAQVTINFFISNLLTLSINYFGLPQIITLIADGLYSRRADILEANKLDLAKAERDGVTGPLFDR